MSDQEHGTKYMQSLRLDGGDSQYFLVPFDYLVGFQDKKYSKTLLVTIFYYYKYIINIILNNIIEKYLYFSIFALTKFI